MAALVISGDTSGTVTLAAPAIAGTQTYTLPTAVPASNGQVLSATTAGVMSWASVSASAAGSTNQIQYNNGGAFAGTANLVWENGTTVGVGGLSSPSTYGDGAYGFVAYGGSTANARGHISLGGNTTAADEAMGKIHFFNSNSTNAIYRVCAIQATRGADNNSGHLIFQTANSGSPSEVFRLSATGAAVLRGGTVGATGVGIAFPATQSASTNANTLDDYEEGTWTPADASGVGLTYTNSSGFYIKTGRVVQAYADFRFPSTSDGNSARFTLPIPVYGDRGGGSLNYFYNGSGPPNTVLSPYPQQWNGIPVCTLNGWSSSSGVSNAYCSLYIFRIFVSYFSDV
jgi:hypothetical protein